MPTPSGISIPYGYCHCGCGGLAPIAKATYPKYLHVKGEPTRYILGHAGHEGHPRPVMDEASLFKIDGVYCRLIPLTRGIWSIVDAADYRWLMQWKWHAHYDPHTRGYYAVRSERGPDGKQLTVKMHRVILDLERDDLRKGDHRNKCTIDNRRKNLRPADNDENSQNARRRKDNTSGVKGISWAKHVNSWLVRVGYNNTRKHIGYFKEFEKAHAALIEAVQALHGEFASFD